MGLFTVILGADGAGKSTLTLALQQAGYQTTTWHEMNGHPQLDMALGWTLKGKSYPLRKNMMPFTRAHIFNTFYSAFYEYVIAPKLQQFDAVIVDSYYYKGMAKELLCGLPASIFSTLHHTLPQPDLIIWLKVRPETALMRRGRQFSEYESVHEQSEQGFITFQTQLDQKIMSLVGSIDTLTIDVDDLTPLEVFERVEGHLQRRLASLSALSMKPVAVPPAIQEVPSR